MTIKNQNKNVSAENKNVVIDVTEQNGVFTIVYENLYNEETDSKHIDVHKLKMKVITNTRLQELEASTSQADIIERESFIFLVPFVDSGDPKPEEGYYREYLWVEDEGEFEVIGSTKIDLEPYFKKEDVYNALDYAQNNNLKALSAYQGKILNDTKVDKETGKGLSSNDYTTAEKTKLAGIETNANKTIVDSSLSDSSINPVQNKVVKASLDNKVDKVTGKGLSSNDYTTAEKTKLAGIETNANKTIVDSSLSDSSINPVQNKVVKASLDNKVDKVTGKDLSSNDYTNVEKTKLANIEPINIVVTYADSTTETIKLLKYNG